MNYRWTGVLSSDSPPRITAKTLPPGVVGEEYRAVIEAKGGAPYQAKRRPKAPRYFEFTWPRLLEEMLQDRVDFGRKGDAIPRLKRYLLEAGEVEYVNQQTWWPGSVVKKSDWSQGEDEGVGFTEDATKHLENLRRRGVIEESVKTAKPELLMQRLLQIFTRDGDVVLECFGEAADLSSVALKKNRRFVFLSGSSKQDRRLLRSCALPRLQGIVRGCDSRTSMSADADETKKRGIFLEYGGGGTFSHLRLARPVASVKKGDQYPYLNHKLLSEGTEVLRFAIVTAEGFIPVSDSNIHGVSFDRATAAVILAPEEFLDRTRISELSSEVAPLYPMLFVYYFRSAEDFDPSEAAQNTHFKRVPVDLTT